MSWSATGEMSERSKEAVLKTVEAKVSGGSNPSLSASVISDQEHDLPVGSSLERCESGRIGLPAKELCWQRHRGFESPPLRYDHRMPRPCGDFLYPEAVI